MDYECFQSTKRRKDSFWDGQTEKKAVAGAGATWEQGTGSVTWTQPRLTPCTLQGLRSLRKGQNCVITGRELWCCFRVTDRYSWHGKAASDEAESHCHGQAWQHHVACEGGYNTELLMYLCFNCYLAIRRLGGVAQAGEIREDQQKKRYKSMRWLTFSGQTCWLTPGTSYIFLIPLLWACKSSAWFHRHPALQSWPHPISGTCLPPTQARTLWPAATAA